MDSCAALGRVVEPAAERLLPGQLMTCWGSSPAAADQGCVGRLASSSVVVLAAICGCFEGVACTWSLRLYLVDSS